jgi:hypothetical protein
MFGTLKLSLNENIVAFFGLETVLATFFQNLAEFFSQSSGRPVYSGWP